jgi:hypothetical protein
MKYRSRCRQNQRYSALRVLAQARAANDQIRPWKTRGAVLPLTVWLIGRRVDNPCARGGGTDVKRIRIVDENKDATEHPHMLRVSLPCRVEVVWSFRRCSSGESEHRLSVSEVKGCAGTAANSTVELASAYVDVGQRRATHRVIGRRRGSRIGRRNRRWHTATGPDVTKNRVGSRGQHQGASASRVAACRAGDHWPVQP